MITFCVIPGKVKSQNDGEIHFVSAGELARLYELEDGEWQVHDSRTQRYCRHLRHLVPASNGSYGRPRE